MKFKLLLSLILMLIVNYTYLDYDKEKKIDHYLKLQTDLFKGLYETHYHDFKQKSQILYDSLVMQDGVLNIYSALQKADKKDKNRLRDELYNFLKDKYEKMKYTNLKQLHFHLKDNESFLRMHKPGKFGDNLSNIRETIVYVNKNSKEIDGFEMGRVYSGLRFVYPILDKQNKHLGSVEVSFDISVFGIEFMEHFKVLSNFHLNGKILKAKTWKESIEDHYIKSPITGFYLEKRNTKVLKEFSSKLKMPHLKADKETLDKALRSMGEKEAVSIYDKNSHTVITFLPVINSVTKDVVAFFSIRNFEGYVKRERDNFNQVILASTVLIMILFFLLNRILKDKDSLNNTLKKRVDEETRELKKVNEELLLFKAVIDNVDAGATISKRDEKSGEHLTIYANKTFEKITGYTNEEIFGKNLRLLQNDDREQESVLIMKEAISKGESCNVEIRNYKKDGTLFYNNVTLSPILNENNEIEHFIGIQNDISQKKINEIKLIEQKNFLDTLIQTAPIAIFCKDINGNYIDANEVWCEFTGFNKSEIIGKSVYDVAPKHIADIYHEQDKKVFSLEENPQIYESKVVNKRTKKEYDVMFYKSAFFNALGEVEGIIGTVVDMTETKQLQEITLKKERLLFEQSKLVSMGEMIGNIAHQWRQPLSVISTAASGMQMKKEMGILKDEEFEDMCIKIVENTEYLSQTIDDFKNFIKGDSKLVEFDLKSDMGSFMKLVDSLIKNYNINVILDINEDIHMKGYPNELIQCFINLFNNSKDAFLENEISEDHRYIFISQYIEKKDVIIEFKDSAGGIPDEIITQVFEPYFTTKHQSLGTGLGLHMTYSLIVNGMNGKIKVENSNYDFNGTNYNGAVFKIILPLFYD